MKVQRVGELASANLLNLLIRLPSLCCCCRRSFVGSFVGWVRWLFVGWLVGSFVRLFVCSLVRAFLIVLGRSVGWLVGSLACVCLFVVRWLVVLFACLRLTT